VRPKLMASAAGADDNPRSAAPNKKDSGALRIETGARTIDSL
jgi:hypothetical protein